MMKRQDQKEKVRYLIFELLEIQGASRPSF